MRYFSGLLLLVLLHCSALASETETASKPIKKSDAASAKSDVKTDSKAESKAEFKPDTKVEQKGDTPVGDKPEKKQKETKEQKAARLRDEKAADELASKIAESLSDIRKAKPQTKVNPAYEAAAAAAAVRSRMNAYTLNRAFAKPKPKAVPEVKIDPSKWTYTPGVAEPEHWGKLTPANSKCESGERQSPIDLKDGLALDLDPLIFEYGPSRFAVHNDGRSIVVKVEKGNLLDVAGTQYDLSELRFHRPSEFSIGGQFADMDVQLLHKDANGKALMLVIQIELSKEAAADHKAEHPVIQQFWNNLPLEKMDAVNAVNEVAMNQLLPSKLAYFTFMGSQTQPPCTEGMVWMVLKQSIHISHQQAAIFERLYPMNARPIQKNFGRIIKMSR
jgi:carbonic anhydrase